MALPGECQGGQAVWSTGLHRPAEPLVQSGLPADLPRPDQRAPRTPCRPGSSSTRPTAPLILKRSVSLHVQGPVGRRHDHRPRPSDTGRRRSAVPCRGSGGEPERPAVPGKRDAGHPPTGRRPGGCCRDRTRSPRAGSGIRVCVRFRAQALPGQPAGTGGKRWPFTSVLQWWAASQSDS